jgi:hypothetical protein
VPADGSVHGIRPVAKKRTFCSTGATSAAVSRESVRRCPAGPRNQHRQHDDHSENSSAYARSPVIGCRRALRPLGAPLSGELGWADFQVRSDRTDIDADSAVRCSWPVALRAVRAWLTPWSVLVRCWQSWSPAPPPQQLQRLLDALARGQPLHLYPPPQPTNHHQGLRGSQK